MFTAICSWPSAPFQHSLVAAALDSLDPPPSVVESPVPGSPTLFWSTYDDIDHELVHSQRDSVLSSSYTFRKALIRKHFLSRCLHSYIIKHPDCKLKDAVPRTFEVEISCVDELDELWIDELWELANELDGSKWWILKPGMADRGNGIRLFNTKEALEKIFQDFEDQDSEDEEDSTAVVTSQLRHFVIQEYLANPLLVDPVSTRDSEGVKFHLRTYCVASGAIEVFVFNKILALFSPVPYSEPTAEEDEDGDPLPVDLAPHLTNTSLQKDHGEEGVRLLEELVGSHVLSGPKAPFTNEDVKSIMDQMVVVLGETFKAAVETPVHFQPIPNAFELFGIDFLVTDSPTASPRFQVKLLEINSEPAIELTGPRLSWILRDLFVAISRTCVVPFFKPEAGDAEWSVGETRHGLIKCLDEEVRGVS
ncbi:tubulin-tyrosine ligase [Roridomyces roridus]|uniref:Tubulin-tyrosine ligase n=1 Tax=Roridomyces roridus TaxID=1738132 RepID=A0AAD7BTX0_9AGAR|nr:tubulin-tyrosine ligase [Roridomyces roridus]